MSSIQDEHFTESNENSCLTSQSSLPTAHWMSGKWGIGFSIPAGDSEAVREFDVDDFICNLQKCLNGASWVIVNLTNGAYGDRYMAPHSVLTKLNPGSTPPKRDLFFEIANALHKIHVRVIAYVATQGPAMLKHGAKAAYDYNGHDSPAMKRWSAYVRARYGHHSVKLLKQAFAEVIIDEYAGRYGHLIDGWWFDHAMYGNIHLLHSIVKKYNPRTATAFAKGQNVPLTINHPGMEDYTYGHPTPMERAHSSSPLNLPMITAVEETPDGYFKAENGEICLGHGFFPVAELWGGGECVWTLHQAVQWLSRMLAAHGAWTWCLPSDHDKKYQLKDHLVDFIAMVEKTRNASCDSMSAQVTSTKCHQTPKLNMCALSNREVCSSEEEDSSQEYHQKDYTEADIAGWTKFDYHEGWYIVTAKDYKE